MLASLCLVLTMPLYSQVEQPLEWVRELKAIENHKSGMEQRKAELLRIRKRVEDWVALHPGLTVDLPPISEGTWTEEQLRAQVLSLQQTIGDCLENY